MNGGFIGGLYLTFLPPPPAAHSTAHRATTLPLLPLPAPAPAPAPTLPPSPQWVGQLGRAIVVASRSFQPPVYSSDEDDEDDTGGD